MFRTRILPAIIAVWGAAVAINTLALGGSAGSGAYGAGQTAGGLFGIVMVVAGVRALLKARTT
jgi:hypothetical protein